MYVSECCVYSMCECVCVCVCVQESQVQELEVRLQNAEADLKTAERRVETLQDALKMQEEEFGSGEDGEDDISRSYDDLSSSGGSYQIGELTGSADDLSDSRDTDVRLSSHLKELGGGRSTTPRVEELTSPTHHTRRNRFNLDAEDDASYSRRKRGNIEDEDDLLLTRRPRKRTPLSDEEEEKKPKKSYLSKLSDEEEDDDLAKSLSRGRNRRVGLSDEEEEEESKWKSLRAARSKRSPEEEDLPRRRYNNTRLSDDEEDRLSPPARGRGVSPLGADEGAGSGRRKNYQLSDNEKEEKPRKRSVSPLSSREKVSPARLNGAKEDTALANGTKLKEGEEGRGGGRRESIKNLVSKEQEQLYSVAQNRRRRRRTGDAKSTRQTATAAAQNNGSAS